MLISLLGLKEHLTFETLLKDDIWIKLYVT